MTIKEINGNLLDSTAGILIHQVNCQGKMGSGVAKAIRDKWPVVFEKYSKFCSGQDGSYLLGKCLPVRVNETQRVMNWFAQDNFGYDGRKYTSYDALDTCMAKTAEYCKSYGIKAIALPYHMSCDRGGANWNVVTTMLTENFKDLDLTIEIWKL